MSEYFSSALIILFFILLGGLFAASELALVSLRESQLASLEQRGKRGALVAKLARDPNTFLGAVQIGVTLSGFTSAAFGAAALSPALAPVLVRLGLDPQLAMTIAVVILTLVIAYLSLVFGELAPKRLALQRAVGLSLLVAPLIAGLAVLFRPVIWLVGKSSDLVVVMFGGDPKKKAEALSSDELISIVETHEGLTDDHKEVLSDVLEAAEHTLESVMRPRSDVVVLRQEMSIAEARQFVARHPYSRYPLVTRSLDDCSSYVHIKDLMMSGAEISGLAELARPIPLLPHLMSVFGAISNLRSAGRHIALVVDEHGGTDGLVSLEDLIEELVGEVFDEHDHPRTQKPIESAGVWKFAGDTPLREVSEQLETEITEGKVVTLGGLVMARLGRMPKIDDVVITDDLELRVAEVSGRRVKLIMVKRLMDHPAKESEAQ